MRHVRTLGSHPAVLDAAVAESRVQVEQRRQQIATDERRLEAEGRRLTAERNRIAATVDRGDGTAEVRERLEQADARLAGIAFDADGARLLALEGGTTP